MPYGFNTDRNSFVEGKGCLVIVTGSGFPIIQDKLA
jgi:hypothetical protein